MPRPTTAATLKSTPHKGRLKRLFHALIGSQRFQAEMSIVFGPYLFVCLIGWRDCDSFWGPKFSFFEQVLLCVLFVLSPSPRDLAFLFSRMDAFRFTRKRRLPYNQNAC